MTDEQRAKRIHYHMYDTNEGIAEHAERIVALEELVMYMMSYHKGRGRCGGCTECPLSNTCEDECFFAEWVDVKAKELGIEAGDD